MRMLFVLALLAFGCSEGRPVRGTMLIGSWLTLYHFPDMATCRHLLGQVDAEIRAQGGRVMWSCAEAEAEAAPASEGDR